MASPLSKFSIAGIRSSIRAFTRKILVSDLLGEATDYGEWSARRLRYKILWSFYENTAYQQLHNWSQAYKAEFGLPDDIEGLRNPVYRLAEFWVAHIWGGNIDPELGDGKVVPSSLPMEFEDDSLREAAIQIFEDSKFSILKDQITLFGTTMGDVFVRVVDDPEEEEVYFQLLHPGDVSFLETDRRGNILRYVVQQERYDPDDADREKVVEYKEIAVLTDDGVSYETFKDNAPYDWYGDGATWTTDSPFMPLVYIQHRDVGDSWGWSEAHPLKEKIHDIDNLASRLSEFVNISVKSPWLISGVKKPKVTPKTNTTAPDSNNPRSGKDEMRVLYGPSGSTAQHLVSPLEIQPSVMYLGEAIKSIENDYPELSMDNWVVTGEVSARALRVIRQKTEKKALQRRVTYDSALKQLLQYAFYYASGYKDYRVKSVEKPSDYDFKIKDRPVFVTDELERLEIEEAFWKAAEVAIRSGYSILLFLKDQGWSEERIKALEEDESYQNRIKLQSLALNQPLMEGLDQDQGGRPSDDDKSKEKIDKPADKEV